MRFVVIGGGAAGFFAAIRFAETAPEGSEVLLLERGTKTLEKVRISGGGRCNLTHACFIPKDLVKYYPRGQKELMGPFHQFACGDTMAWFESRGVEVKIEDDGRVFPQSNNSETIVNCLVSSAEKAGVKIMTSCRVDGFTRTPEGQWLVTCNETETILADRLMIATGSNSRIWDCLEALGHTIVPPVPSLFTFNIKDSRLEGIPGISLPKVEVSIVGAPYKITDNFLVTHWGLSGFAVLKLSSWAARELHDKQYKYQVEVNFCPGYNTESMVAFLMDEKARNAKRTINAHPLLGLPLRLWQKLTQAVGIPDLLRWGDISRQQLRGLAEQLTRARFDADGKSTFKEEFVTAGGVSLKEIDFKRFSSRLFPDLFLAGEVLDIDALTGGFNFQAAWTGGWIAGAAACGLA